MKTSTKVFALGSAGLGALWWKKHRGVGSHRVGNPDVPDPRKPVDLTRYFGLWHEVARYEQSFERGRQASTAEYALRADGRGSIRNSCHLAGGRMSSVDGKAKIVDPATNAKLKVSFFGPFHTGDYWILDHADDYSWSVVGEP
jgi:apolipoprotein D and lipocalin family protein